jgi:hypothetical protein
MEKWMSSLESVPAVRRIETDRRSLHAFDVVGHVSAADIENLYGLLEAAYVLDPQIDVLLRVVDNEGVDWQEVAPDTIRQGKAHAREHVRRCAVVGDRLALAATRGLFLDAAPVDFRQFAPEDEQAAWEWVEERG